MLSTPIGIIHFTASILAIIAGTLTLWGWKGTKLHVRTGYVYAALMLVVLVTSFMIYRLHGTFGILHWLAVVSSLTLLAGIIPMWTKRPKANYLGYHFSFMYWSVIGLYCAFFAEVFTRIPHIYEVSDNVAATFYMMVGISTAIVGGIGGKLFGKYKARWMVFEAPAKDQKRGV